MERNILMGIDVGTTSLRVGFYDQYGKNYGFYAAHYDLLHPHNTWVEQKVSDWILALEKAVKEGMGRFHIRKEQILGLSMGSTCCSVLCGWISEPSKKLRKLPGLQTNIFQRNGCPASFSG